MIVVAVNANNELLLIREYAAGFHELQLTLPKGVVDAGETLGAAASRELAEEAGFAANHTRWLNAFHSLRGIWVLRSMWCLPKIFILNSFKAMNPSP